MTTDAHTVKPLADALEEWAWHSTNTDALLRDAITQATKAETIEWLASLAERYGFKPPEST